MGIAPKHVRSLRAALPGSDPAAVRRRLEAMELMLERAFVIPGLNRRVGLDSVVGLIPGVGDLITASMGVWLVLEARNLGMSRWQLARMAGNVGLDTAVGAIPLAGDLFDFMFRSNSKNLRIVKRHLDKHHPAGAVVEGTKVEASADPPSSLRA